MNDQDSQDSLVLQKYFDEHQVSETTTISVKTLQKYRHDMCGPCYVKLGRRVAYPEKDLAEWLHKNRVQTSSKNNKIKEDS